MRKIFDAKLGIHILEVEITTRCNFDCKHCYNRGNKVIDLPIEKFKELYEFANKYKVWIFVITGGEPLLHPQFNEIISFIKSTPRNFRLSLQTNGSLINNNIIKKLKFFDLIHLSFDLSDALRKGGKENLELAKKISSKGVKCYLFTTIHKMNLHLIDDMVATAKSANIPIAFNICQPTERLGEHFLLSKEEFMNVEKKLFTLFKRKRILRYSSPLVSLFDKNKKSKFQRIKGGCSAGVAACVVAPNGEVYPCPFLRLSAGNIFETPLEEIWLNSNLLNKLRKRLEFAEPCGSCEYLSFCGGCRYRAFLKSGDIQGADPMCYKELLHKKHGKNL
jgi:radical SAM protein with 4Fe4S-binding SPASM domain